MCISKGRAIAEPCLSGFWMFRAILLLVCGIFPLASFQFRIHPGENSFRWDQICGAKKGIISSPMIRRHIERYLLLIRGNIFDDINILDRIVIASPHFRYMTVYILVGVPFPDLDDLFSIRTAG